VGDTSHQTNLPSAITGLADLFGRLVVGRPSDRGLPG